MQSSLLIARHCALFRDTRPFDEYLEAQFLFRPPIPIFFIRFAYVYVQFTVKLLAIERHTLRYVPINDCSCGQILFRPCFCSFDLLMLKLLLNCSRLYFSYP